MQILIAGCGYVGCALAQNRITLGDTVFGLRRTLSLNDSNIIPITADLANPQSLSNFPKPLDYVCFTAAADQSSDQAYEKIYIHGLSNLLNALKNQQSYIKRFFFTSSSSVYSQNQGEWVDEHSATKPESFSGKRMVQAEHLLKKSGFPYTILRLGGIYGPNRTRLIRSIQSGKASYQPEPSRYTNRIHQQDCAGILSHLIDLKNSDTLYLGVDCEPSPYNTVISWIAKELGITINKYDQNSPLTEKSNKRCCNAKILATGYQFLYPTFQEGYGSVLEGTNQ